MANLSNIITPSNVLTATNTATLTNKTLADPKITLAGSNGTSGQALVSQGAGVAPAWANLGSEIVRVARTSNTALTSSNKGNLIDITSGTFTQTFNACSSLGSGWFCYIRNSGTGDITLDPNGSETIDGLTSYVMYPGEIRLIQCDGTNLITLVLEPFYKVFTSSGTFTTPPGYLSFQGLLWGAGGNGGSNFTVCSGGGGGACVPLNISSSAMGSSQTVTISAGSGGTSSIGSLVSAYGGGSGGVAGSGSLSGGGGGGALSAGGSGSASNSTGGNPSIVPTSTVNNPGLGGAGGFVAAAGGVSAWGGGAGGGSGSSSGGASVYGGGGGAGGGGSGGTSVFGGAGGSFASRDGVAPGGGGAAGNSTTAGGQGARGELRIWGVA